MNAVLALLVALCVSLGTAKITFGGWSDSIKPQFPKDNEAVVLISEVDKELRPLLAAEVKDDPNILTAPITVNAYKKQVVAGKNYDIQIEVTRRFFAVYILSPLKGSPKVQKVVGPLGPNSPEFLIKP